MPLKDSDLWRVVTRALIMVTTVLVTISISLTAWSLTRVVDLETRISIIESNRFTSTDALDLMAGFTAKIDILTLEVTKMTSRLDYVDKLEKRVEGIERSIHLLDVSMAVIAEHLDRSE